MPGDKRRRWLPLESLSSVAAVIVALSLFLAAVVFLNLNLARLKASFGWATPSSRARAAGSG